MDIAAMRVRITFQKNGTAADEIGNHLNEWTDYFSCFATAGTSSGSESTGEVINTRESIDFTCRWCGKLSAVTSTKYRILLGDKVYNIASVNPMGYRKNSVKFHCEREIQRKGGG